MSELPPTRDHLAKKATPKVEPYFTFTVNGTEHTMPVKTADVMTVGFVRKNRDLSDGDFLFLALEALADETILDAIDTMLPGSKAWEKLQDDFKEHVGAQTGE